eukprot:10253956-Lingulodinium_polyedra.AAC.1
MSIGEEARSIVEETFPRCAAVANVDLHRSSEAGERHLREERPRWPSAKWRCIFHRSGTAQGRSLAMDPPTESALFNVGLLMDK